MIGIPPFVDLAAVRRDRILSGLAAAEGFELQSNGEPGVKYAAQMSIRRRAGRWPWDMLVELFNT